MIFLKPQKDICHSNSISESQDSQAFVCRYKIISTDMPYQDSLQIPEIKEIFAEHLYLKFDITDTNIIGPYYKMIDRYQLSINFDSTGTTCDSQHLWKISKFSGTYPNFHRAIGQEVPDTLSIKLLHYWGDAKPGRDVYMPAGTITLKRVD